MTKYKPKYWGELKVGTFLHYKHQYISNENYLLIEKTTNQMFWLNLHSGRVFENENRFTHRIDQNRWTIIK